MWTSENLADMGVTGIYNVLRSDNVAGDLHKFDSYGVSADYRDGNYSLLRGNATTSDSQFSNYWRIHYEGVSRANDAIANLPNAPLDESKRNRLIAESKFLRAYFYYKLNMMYKGVPLYLEPTELEGFTKGRDTEEAVWNQVIQDLTDAINTADLPDKYAAGSGDYGRVTKGAAYALRGKAYMWMENWAAAPEVLQTYARHWKTGEPMPQELIDKIQASRLFNQGFTVVEFMSAALLDMAYHSIQDTARIDAEAFEQATLDRIGLIPEITVRYRSPYFSHIFNGGYAAGYYVYTWAEVLDADAFAAFKETGDIFNPEKARAFREYILSRGGSDDPMKLYQAFRGKEPSIDPLLRRKGLLHD